MKEKENRMEKEEEQEEEVGVGGEGRREGFPSGGNVIVTKPSFNVHTVLKGNSISSGDFFFKREQYFSRKP